MIAKVKCKMRWKMVNEVTRKVVNRMVPRDASKYSGLSRKERIC